MCVYGVTEEKNKLMTVEDRLQFLGVGAMKTRKIEQ